MLEYSPPWLLTHAHSNGSAGCHLYPALKSPRKFLLCIQTREPKKGGPAHQSTHQVPTLPPTGCQVRVGWVDMPTEPSESSEYLVAAGGISETCKGGRHVFPAPANAGGLLRPLRWAAAAGWGCAWAARGPYGQRGWVPGCARPACHPQSSWL